MERVRQALRLVSQAMAKFSESVTDYDKLLQVIVRAIAEVVPDTAFVSLTSDDATTLKVVAVHDEDPAVVGLYQPMVGTTRPVSEVAKQSLAGTVFMPSVDLTAMRDAVPPDSFAAMEKLNVRGLILVPMRSRGELLGIVSVLRHRADRPTFDEMDREIAEHLGNQAALLIANARMFKRLERSEELRVAEARTAHANRMVDAILENIPDMVFVKEAKDLTFVRFNRAGEDLLGIPRDQLMGKSDYDFFPRSEADFFIKKDRETLANRILVDIPEEPILTKRGQRWLHTKKVPLLDDAGEPAYLLGISHDITEQKHAHAALAEAKDKAEAASKELESFSYSVAHDLRAPLRAIDGFAQALLEDYGEKLDVVGNRHLERIRAGAQRMAMLIDDLLELSRVTRAEHRRERVDVSVLVRAVVGRLERAEPTRKVEVVLPNHLPAHGDPKLLEIALENLISNAWKFTAKADSARIEVGVEQKAGERVFFVRDNGAGFDMKYRDKLFGVFQRLHAVHEYPGTGIGLATVKRIIERHGGRVWAEGEPGKGATFYFTISETP